MSHSDDFTTRTINTLVALERLYALREQQGQHQKPIMDLARELKAECDQLDADIARLMLPPCPSAKGTTYFCCECGREFEHYSDFCPHCQAEFSMDSCCGLCGTPLSEHGPRCDLSDPALEAERSR